MGLNGITHIKYLAWSLVHSKNSINISTMRTTDHPALARKEAFWGREFNSNGSDGEKSCNLTQAIRDLCLQSLTVSWEGRSATFFIYQ